MGELAESAAGKETCPVCEGTDFTRSYEKAEAICDNCGVVITDWSDSKSYTAVGVRPDEEDDPSDSWSDVRPAYNSTEHRISSAIETIEAAANPLFVPASDRISAAERYVSAAMEGITEGRSLDVVAAAALYQSGKCAGNPRPSGRIADHAGVETDALDQATRCLQRELVDRQCEAVITVPEDYLEFLVLDLGIDENVVSQAESLLDVVHNELAVAGKHPAGVAAGAVYVSATDPPSQRDIAAVAGVSTETLRTRLREIQSVEREKDV